ncbi:DUF5131 family protein [Gaopeijia maritima]|uniref:DUF5131 family protein n=1 Tax=Gaopeijia maritima TaxID=3119007 RepID=UPI00327EB9CB
MAENSGIQWTDHTFNPWWGCTKVSPGCANCYAETLAVTRRKLPVWGPAPRFGRKLMSEGHWKGPEKWNRAAAAAGERHRVFCASMADVFDEHPDVTEPRARLFDLIERTPHLDWQLLTKRPHRVLELVPPDWHDGFPSNVWLGTSVEDQQRAEERIPILLQMPAAVRFLSCEPLLGPVDLDGNWGYAGSATLDVLDEWPIDWVIVGGESGPGARPCNVEWIRSLVGQCRNAGTAVFVKQLGSRPCSNVIRWADPDRLSLGTIHDRKGGDPEEWPEDLRVREFPTPLRRCRACGCTDLDCRSCVEATGHPCYWVEGDLCSRCEARA